MKIFSNNFSVEFRARPHETPFEFEEIRYKDLIEKLYSRELYFPHQVFYIKGKNTPKFLKRVLKLQSDERIKNLKGHVIIYFPDDKSKLGFEEAYTGAFKQVIAAGGLVLNPKGEFLLIYRRKKWDLPKGKLDDNETIEECAVREVSEETGIRELKIQTPLITTYHTYFDKSTHILKPSHWYLMKSDQVVNLKPQLEEDITEVKWASFEEWAKSKVETYALVSEVVREAIRKSHQ